MQKHRADSEAIAFLYNTLEEDRDSADTSEIIQKLNAIVSEAIDVAADPAAGDKIFDISKVNFELLRREFAKSEQKHTDVQDMKTVIENRLRKMLAENPLCVDFQERFDDIVREYNKEKDKNTIEATFEALMRLTAECQRKKSVTLQRDSIPKSNWQSSTCYSSPTSQSQKLRRSSQSPFRFCKSLSGKCSTSRAYLTRRQHATASVSPFTTISMTTELACLPRAISPMTGRKYSLLAKLEFARR